MKRTKLYYIEFSLIILFSLGLFALFAINHVQNHFTLLLIPVPIAVFIIRYKIKDGIIPAVILIVGASLMSHFFSADPGSYLRGLLYMIAAMSVGFLHGAITKTPIDHFHEILIIIGVEIFFNFLMVIVFYVVKDPMFAYDIEFAHYYEVFSKIFKIDQTSFYAQNVRVIIENGVIPHTINSSIISVLLTHAFIHLTLKYICRDDITEGPFEGFEYEIPKAAAIAFLIGCVAVVATYFTLKYELKPIHISLINVLFNLVFSTVLVFSLQGALMVDAYFHSKGRKRLSVIILLISVLLFPIFAFLGVFNSLIKRSNKANKTEEIKDAK
ncbi:MAG: hypothetical protein ACOX3C_03495 [Bacilli bacterium]|jgi:hypothetical protein